MRAASEIKQIRNDPEPGPRTRSRARRSANQSRIRQPYMGNDPVMRLSESPSRESSLPIPARSVNHEATATVHEVLRTPGHTLPLSSRSFMESHFGQDFSQVRVHTDERATESARALNASAYTVGRDVVFDAARYRPETFEGQRLLAHELAHVVQQRGGTAGDSVLQKRLTVDESDAPAEREADRMASRVMNGESVQAQTAGASLTVQRDNGIHLQRQENKAAPAAQSSSLRDVTVEELRFILLFENLRINMLILAANKLLGHALDIIHGDAELLRGKDSGEKARIRVLVRKRLNLATLFKDKTVNYNWLTDKDAAAALNFIMKAADIIIAQATRRGPYKVELKEPRFCKPGEDGACAVAEGTDMITFSTGFFDPARYKQSLCWTWIIMHEYMHLVGVYHGQRNLPSDYYKTYQPEFIVNDANSMTRLVFDLALPTSFLGEELSTESFGSKCS